MQQDCGGKCFRSPVFLYKGWLACYSTSIILWIILRKERRNRGGKGKKQCIENGRRHHAHHASRQGAWAGARHAYGARVRHGHGGKRLFDSQPHPPQFLRRDLCQRHFGQLYSGVQRISGEEGPGRGLPFGKRLHHGHGAGHRSDEPCGHGLFRPAYNAARRRLRR